VISCGEEVGLRVGQVGESSGVESRAFFTKGWHIWLGARRIPLGPNDVEKANGNTSMKIADITNENLFDTPNTMPGDGGRLGLP
jgi:hypothetical protein